jgi:hypothetical protein
MAAQFSASPFVASDRPGTTDFQSSLVSEPGSPFSVSVNTFPVHNGTYAGVLVTPTRRVTSGFQNLSFLLKGSETTTVTVHFRKPRRSSFAFSSLPAKQGHLSDSSEKNAYRRVSFDATQFGIPTGSQIDKIVISPDTSKGGGTFLVNDIHVNGMPATKEVKNGTLFYKVVDNLSKGPLEGLTRFHRFHSALGTTSMTLTNGTTSTITVFMTSFPGFGSSYTSGANVPLSGVTISQDPNNSAIGYFTLNPNQTTTYSAGLDLDVNIYCAIDSTNPTNDAQCLGSIGATFAEVNINNGGQEVVDISEVNGVNAQMQITLPHGSYGACTWSNGDYSTGGTIPNGGDQQIPITTILNQPGPGPNYYGDYGNPGVYPFGCDNCISRYNLSPPVFAAGCSSVTYPSSDVGCNNAINTYQPTYTSPPTGVTALPTDSYAPGGLIYDQSLNSGSSYGICQANRTSCPGGVVAVTIVQYPWNGIPSSLHGHPHHGRHH